MLNLSNQRPENVKSLRNLVPEQLLNMKAKHTDSCDLIYYIRNYSNCTCHPERTRKPSTVNASSKTGHRGLFYLLRSCALCGSNRVANSGLTGSETGNKDRAVAREPEETRGSQTGDSEGQTDGGVTDFTDRDSRQERQQDCGNHKEGEGETWAIADGKSNGQKRRGRPGPRRWAHREGEEFALSTRNEKSPVQR